MKEMELEARTDGVVDGVGLYADVFVSHVLLLAQIGAFFSEVNRESGCCVRWG